MKKLKIEITDQMYDFLQEANGTGLYGSSIEETFLRLAERQAERLLVDGIVERPSAWKTPIAN